MERKILKPGYFTEVVAADNLRSDYDIKNELIIRGNHAVDFVFFGDSITQMWELNVCFGRKKMIVNRGIAGDKTRYALKRFSADVVQFYPKHCIMLLGINDFYEVMPNIFQLSEGKSYEIMFKEVSDNIERMVEEAKSEKINVVLCSLIPEKRDNEASNTLRGRFEVEFNERLKEIAERNNLIFVDYASALVKQKEPFTTDGTHPNYIGYTVMTETLKQTLAEHNIEIE